MTTYDVRVGGKSDIGKVRKENQDALLISQPDDEDVLEHKGVLVVLADGMGGLEDGREASQLAVDTIKRFYYSYKRDPRTGIEKAVQQANTAIYMKSTQGPESRQMGSTVTAFAVIGDQAVVAQVGDSRAYRIRDGKIQQITRDHSLVRELLDRGEIDRDSDQYAFHRNILTRGLGLREEVVVDTYELIGLHPGDTFLLSSDGLHELVSEAELCASVDRTDVDLDEACQSLVDLACERGAPDNSTVALVQVNLAEHECGVPITPVLGGGAGWASARFGLSPLIVLLSFIAGVLLTLWLVHASFLTETVRQVRAERIQRQIDLLDDPLVPDSNKANAIENLRRMLRELRLLAPDSEDTDAVETAKDVPSK